MIGQGRGDSDAAGTGLTIFRFRAGNVFLQILQKETLRRATNSQSSRKKVDGKRVKSPKKDRKVSRQEDSSYVSRRRRRRKRSIVGIIAAPFPTSENV